MGVYLRFNRYYFQGRKHLEFIERKRLIKNLINSKLISNISNLSCYYESGSLELKREDFKHSNFKDIFAEIKEKYSQAKFKYFELEGELNLYNKELDILGFPVKIKVWKRLRSRGYGHISIVMDEKFDFNSFFLGPEDWAVKNKDLLIEKILKLNKIRLGPRTYLIDKINIGAKASPLEYVKDAFFIWRNTANSAYLDIMLFRDQLRREVNRIKIGELSEEESEKIEKIKEEMLKPYEIYYIPRKSLDSLTVNIVLRYNYLIDDFIQKKAVFQKGSAELATQPRSNELLFSTLYDLNLKINKVWKIKIPTKETMNDQVKEGFFEVFKSKYEYTKEIKENIEKMKTEFASYFQKIKNNILNLKENWDGYKSKSYREETLKKIKLFLIKLFEDLLILYNIKPGFPKILPGIDGDIDIEWKNKDFQFLISIPEGDDELAGLYGSDYGDDEIELDFNIEEPNLELYAWIKRQVQ